MQEFQHGDLSLVINWQPSNNKVIWIFFCEFCCYKHIEWAVTKSVWVTNIYFSQAYALLLHISQIYFLMCHHNKDGDTFSEISYWDLQLLGTKLLYCEVVSTKEPNKEE